MTNKLITAFAVGAGMFALMAVGQAQNMPSSSGKSAVPLENKSSSTKEASGEVTSVDAKSGKLMVKTSTEELNLDVHGTTAKKHLSNIKVGDKVNVSFQDKGGMLVARSVTKASGSSKDGLGSSSNDNMGSKIH